jgi:hypothetical protein
MTLPSSNSGSSSSSGGVPVPHKLCPGDAYSYWRWAAALTFALADVAPPTEGTPASTAASVTNNKHREVHQGRCVLHYRSLCTEPCTH